VKLIFLGFGTIGRIIYEEISRQEKYTVLGYFDPFTPDKDETELAAKGLLRYRSMKEMIAAKPDVVVEAANLDVAQESVLPLLTEGIDVVSLSVGAYLNKELFDKIKNRDSNTMGDLMIPSGALPGLDVIKAAATRPIHSVSLTTRKPPRALAGAAGVSGVSLAELTEPIIVFEGTAAEAIKLFPQNVNIAATLSLAGIGPEKTRVTIIADPGVDVNIHEVVIAGVFGQYKGVVECQPSSNPKTSLLAALSAVTLLNSIGSKVKIGT